MLTASDLIHLPCTSDLIDAGIAYVCRSLALSRSGKGPSGARHLRRTIAGVAAELAFRRHLQEQSIRFKILANTPFTDPDRYDISMDGRRCQLIIYLLTHGEQVSLLRQDPSLLLEVPALIPSDEFMAEYHRADDRYLFAFFLGKNPQLSNHPPFYIHQLPLEWAGASHRLPLRDLALKYEGLAPLPVELGGLDGRHELLTARLNLPPRVPFPGKEPFFSLAYVHPLERPGDRLQLSSPMAGGSNAISPSAWEDLWVEAEEILLAGWLSHEEVRRRSSLLNIGSRTLQFDRTRVKNRAVPLARLEPIASLLGTDKKVKS